MDCDKEQIKNIGLLRKEKERRQALQGSCDRLRQQAYNHIYAILSKNEPYRLKNTIFIQKISIGAEGFLVMTIN
ncbi:hypothetical protein QD47_24955 [Paenibacillus terrae]|uniref:Uncharacterized protein n=1 Tax=Paenibacillus terrae TaxID=159743 RepID=A0A0D7WV18_9BACL|nr:hypothetical protein QD47_24955 [Paenibacillus terrae]